ncbi:hypothetical protein C804_02697 [Lachnospiraceae bacterium A4]|nr:hypothetical protein C804_02697 [Lachnospiraceae bacterium A4]
MQHGIIRTWAEGKVTDNRSKSKFIGTQHKADRNGNKPAESSFSGETGFKVA